MGPPTIPTFFENRSSKFANQSCSSAMQSASINAIMLPLEAFIPIFRFLLRKFVSTERIRYPLQFFLTLKYFLVDGLPQVYY